MDEMMVAPNCLQCHAQVFEDRLDHRPWKQLFDFTKETMSDFKWSETLLKTYLALTQKSMKLQENFIKVVKPLDNINYTLKW